MGAETRQPKIELGSWRERKAGISGTERSTMTGRSSVTLVLRAADLASLATTLLLPYPSRVVADFTLQLKHPFDLLADDIDTYPNLTTKDVLLNSQWYHTLRLLEDSSIIESQWQPTPRPLLKGSQLPQLLL